MDLDELLLHPHLEGSPALYAQKGSPEARLFRAVRANDWEAARACLEGVNPNVLNIEDHTPLSVAVSHDNEKMVELLLSSGADPYFPNRWAYQNPTSPYHKRLAATTLGAMHKAGDKHHWHWVERFAQMGIPSLIPSEDVEGWASGGVVRGMPMTTWVVLREASRKIGLELSLREALQKTMDSKKGIGTPVGEYALLAKQEAPEGYLSTWEAVLEDVCSGVEYNANSFKKREISTLLNLWVHDAVASGRAWEAVQSTLVGWGMLALQKRRPWFVGEILKKPLKGYAWTAEQRLDYLKTAWDDSYTLAGAPVKETLAALRQHWKPADFTATVKALHVQEQARGGLWLLALPVPNPNGNGPDDALDRATARMTLLLDSGIGLPEADQAKWLSRLYQAPGVKHSNFWKAKDLEPFVRVALRAGLGAGSRSLEGVTLLDAVEAAFAKATDLEPWSKGLTLLKASALEESLPAPAVAVSKPRF